MKPSFVLFLVMIALFLVTTSSMADDFWDLPSEKKAKNTLPDDNDFWKINTTESQPSQDSDDDFWSGKGNSSLDNYLHDREEKRQARIAEEKQQEEERRQQAEQARLEAKAREAEARRQAQIDAQIEAQKRQAQQSSNSNLFGKMLAVGMGAAIAGGSSLDDATKVDFLTNYAADVLSDDTSMSNTNQWKNNSTQVQGANKSSGGVSEADRNRQISSRCKQDSKNYNDGDGQSTPQCQLAIYNKCVADKLCPLYPNKCGSLRARVSMSCEILSKKMGDKLCPVCR